MKAFPLILIFMIFEVTAERHKDSLNRYIKCIQQDFKYTAKLLNYCRERSTMQRMLIKDENKYISSIAVLACHQNSTFLQFVN